MGAGVESTSSYTCPGCGYHVDRMVSGYAAGPDTHVVGVSCDDCRALRIARIPGRPSEASAHAAAAAVAAGHVPAGVRCPHSARHHLTLWTAPGPCPRCGTTLQPPRERQRRD